MPFWVAVVWFVSKMVSLFNNVYPSMVGSPVSAWLVMATASAEGFTSRPDATESTYALVARLVPVDGVAAFVASWALKLTAEVGGCAVKIWSGRPVANVMAPVDALSVMEASRAVSEVGMAVGVHDDVPVFHSSV
jgi:hypothetical protein